MSLFNELRRRNVFRVGIAYVLASWVFLQLVDVIGDILQLPAWLGQAILAILVAGFIPALMFAWAFEMTPEGLKRERDVGPDESIAPLTGRRLDRVIISVLLVAVAWFAWDRFGPGDSVESDIAARPSTAVGDEAGDPPLIDDTDSTVPVVAVLPFKFVGSDDGGFLAAGLHDDLLTRLAKLAAFKVISRTSMGEYVDTTKNMRQIGQELGAEYILEGGVQARGERVRINAQLIHAPVDEHLWAEIYDRELTAGNLFDVQAELAHAIATAMRTTLDPTDSAMMAEVPTESLDAYNAYLRGIQLSVSAGQIGTVRDRDAVSAFETAVELDPGFAVAWAKLAGARLRADCCNYSQAESEAVLSALAQARALQPGMIESELAWAEYLYRAMREYGQALATLDALGGRIEGDARAWELKGYLHRRLGQYDLAYEAILAAHRLEPRSPGPLNPLVHYAYLLDDCEGAGRHMAEMKALEGLAVGELYREMEYVLECHGDVARAVDLLKQLDLSHGGGRAANYVAFQSRDPELARSVFDRVRSEWAAQGPHVAIWRELNLADLYRHVAPDHDRATGALAKAEELLNDYALDETLREGSMFAILKAAYFGLRGDVENSRLWIDRHRTRFHTEFKGDLAEAAVNRMDHAWIFANAGLYDEAVEELRVMLEQPGGHRFPYFDGLPVFDPLRDHPGYVALRERYGQGMVQ